MTTSACYDQRKPVYLFLLFTARKYKEAVSCNPLRIRFLQIDRRPVVPQYDTNFYAGMQYMLNEGNETRVRTRVYDKALLTKP